MKNNMATLKDWYQKNRSEVEKDLCTFLRFPSISTDPVHKQDILNTAAWLKSYLTKIGMEVELWETPIHPVVFASYMKAGPDRPTLLIYHHYDVQPVDPLELWERDPFDPVIKNNQVVARGAMDNKGQCFYTITALKAFLEHAQECNVNIKLFIEGEEEVGSRGTLAILEKKKKELAADHLLIIDAGIPAKERPAITLGFRGLVSMSIELSNAAGDLHSGIHGGIVLNPIRALIQLLARCWDEEGRIAVPHFYDDVLPLSKQEIAPLDMQFDVEEYKKKFGVNAFSSEKNCSLIESSWLRPTLEVNGIIGGYTGEGFKTVIPAKASAKVSCRLPSSCDPQRIENLLGEFFRLHTPKGMKLTIIPEGNGPGVFCSHEKEIARISKNAFEAAFDKECGMILCGATVPIVAALKKASGAEIAIIGVGLDDDQIHAPNERFGLDRFEKGVLIIGEILRELSEQV